MRFICGGCGHQKEEDPAEAHPACDDCWHPKYGERVMRPATEAEIATGRLTQQPEDLPTAGKTVGGKPTTFYIEPPSKHLYRPNP